MKKQTKQNKISKLFVSGLIVSVFLLLSLSVINVISTPVEACDCQYSCIEPNALNDQTVDIPDNTDLQTMLNNYNAETATIDVNNDQNQTQQFDFFQNVNQISFEVEFVGQEAGHYNVLGYYLDNDPNTFVEILETKNDENYSAPIVTSGDIIQVDDVDVSGYTSISFAIASKNGYDPYMYYMHNTMNNNSLDRALVFERCNETNGYVYVICFEDLPDPGDPGQNTDNDYEDVVAIVRIKSCEGCERDKPLIHKYPEGVYIDPENLPDHPNPHNVDYFIQSNTEMNATVNDNSTFEVYYKKWSESETEPTSWIPWFDSQNPEHNGLFFTENGLHYLHIKAIDECGNIAFDNETFCVDETDPTQDVVFGYPQNTTNVPGLIGISGDTTVSLTSNDFVDSCGVGSESLTYQLYLNGTPIGDPITVEDGSNEDANDSFGVITVELDNWTTCMHQIHFACKDLFGNGNELLCDYDYTDFWVDANPPTAETSFSKPNFYEAWSTGFTWLNCDGLKYINITDTGCTFGSANPNGTSGVDRIEWTVGIDYYPFDNDVEYNYNGVVVDNDNNDSNPEVGVINMTIPFDVGENPDCLHIIEHRVYDKFGNWADIPKQYVKVDCTPPNITKNVNGPLCGPDEDEYGNDVWCVTMDTFINFTVEDEGCFWQADDPGHPGIGLDTVYYRVWNMTHGWSSPIEANYDCENNIANGSYQFTEECKHYLEIVAIDKLGNMRIDNETFYVDEQAPEIHKVVGDPNCPIDGTDDYCVTMDTVISATATNLGCCVNQTITMDYRIWNESDGWTAWMPYTPGDDITFDEECKHYLEIRATDCLGNENVDNETFYVDEQAPEIHKVVGEPSYLKGTDSHGNDVWYVTSTTIINATADNGGCCINQSITMEYRTWYCGQWSSWLPYSPEQHLTFEYESKYFLEIKATDCLGHTNIDNETFYVDETPPHIIILKPTNGWYAPGSVIPSVVLSEDIMNPHPNDPCESNVDTHVGIEDGQQGKAWIIDLFPEFKIIELDTENFLYDSYSNEYIGNIKVPLDINITDGAALFLVGSEDRLGNNWTSIHEVIHAYVIQTIMECPSENCVVGTLSDILADFIADQNIVFVGIDSTPPEVEFDEEEAPIPEVLFPGFQFISVNVSDNLSGIDSGTPCYVTLNGASLGTLWYDPFMQGCSGSVIVPQLPFNLDDAELSISVYDHAGNKGTDTVIVDYLNQASDVIPTVVILNPEDNTNHTGTLTVEIQAHDSGYDGTPMENLTVFVRLMHEEEPSMKYYATFNETTDTFFVEIDISKYTHGSILDIQAFATDDDGYTGDSDFRLYRVHSNIIQDQWFGPGWNLINIVDLCGEILPVEEVLESIDGHYDWVFEVGSWNNFYTVRSIQNLTDMEEGKWYWINITTWQGVRFYLEECFIPSENMPPVAVNDSYTSIVREFNEDIVVNNEDDGVLSNDSDSDGDPITAHLVADASYGSVTLNENGSFIYIPDDREMGVYVDSFTYVARDDKGAESDVATVFITYYTTDIEY